MRIRPTGLLIVIATCVLMPAQVGLARTMVSGLDDATLTVPGGTTDFPPGYEDYHTYAEMMADITAIAAAHPDIVAVSSIGLSYEGREIPIVKISDNVNVDENEPEILIDGLHHAREHLATEQALEIISMLVDGYGTNPRITRLVDTRVWWIIPMVNPDGSEWDIHGGHFHRWRKNRQPNGPGQPIGTDLNRNYSFDWGCCSGSSGHPGSEYYRGPAPFSAPETQDVRDFVESRVIGGKQQITVHLTFHSTGEEVLWPWAHTSATTGEGMTRDDHRVFVALGTAMAQRNGYTAEQSDKLYPTDGDEIDWMFGAQGIFSFTIELYPKGGGGSNRWYTPESLIGPETTRNNSAVLYLASKADCPWKVIGKAAQYCG